VRFHAKYNNITAELHKCITKYAGKGIHWYCNGCAAKADKVLGTMRGIQERQDCMGSTSEALKNDMSEIKAALPWGGLSFADIVREENLV